ncbi:MAG: D-tyrosyl-tRNA(Tyr) deacylase, partial [Bacteroidales bacterium]|nr:D-tyrosyl-tRNA(Tyr) deacylase [Bacteroidales bacterium]
MRVVIQRVSEASVKINNNIAGKIKTGMLVLLGIEEEDNQEDINWLCSKIVKLRIFNDENNVMNLSINNINGDILLISQFTLHAGTKKGNRPSYIKAAKPDFAIPMYEKFIKQLEFDLGKPVQKGEFGAYMEVGLINDGPVTIIIDS